MTRRDIESATWILIGLFLLGLTWVVSQSATALLAVGLALLILPVARRYRARPEVLTDAVAIASRLESLRVGASSFSAIWSVQYQAVEVERYFEAERVALANNPELRISRVINPTVISPRHYDLLEEIRAQYDDRFTLYENFAIQTYELYVIDYPGDRESIAVVVVIDNIRRRPTVGLVLNPERDARLVGAVEAVRVWFDSIREPLPEFDPIAIERWDHIAPRYTRYITENANHLRFLERFMADERRLLAEQLDAVIGSEGDFVLIEIGCGDGRILADAVPEPLVDRLTWLIGIDYAAEMIQVSQRRLAQRNRELTGRPGLERLRECTRLYRLNALDMQRYFDDGQITDLEHLRATAPDFESSGIDLAQFASSRKVLCCLLNTLGVIESHGHRLAVVRTMLAALGPGDALLLSVFAADVFRREAPSLYRGLEKMLDMPIETASFGTDTFAVGGTPGYFSHWFSEAELTELTNKAMLGLASEQRVFYPPTVQRVGDGGYFLIVQRAH